MAQCTRDINRQDCRRCLDDQLVSFGATIGNKRRWEIYGPNCFMWYNDYQFYANVSTLQSGESFDFWLVLFQNMLFISYNCLSYRFDIHHDTVLSILNWNIHSSRLKYKQKNTCILSMFRQVTWWTRYMHFLRLFKLRGVCI